MLHVMSFTTFEKCIYNRKKKKTLSGPANEVGGAIWGGIGRLDGLVVEWVVG